MDKGNQTVTNALMLKPKTGGKTTQCRWRSFTFCLIGLCIILANGCREPYDMELREGEASTLVVEGYVEVDGKGSQIKISRTVPLGQRDSLALERHAYVKLESEGMQIFEFEETSPGIYTLNEALDEHQRYQLMIRLANEEVYMTDYLEAQIGPEIEEVGFNKRNDGISIYVNTQGSSNYFLWDFEETWTFRSAIVSSYIYNPEFDVVSFRTPEQKTDLCWKSSHSDGIVMETSRRFAGDYIFQKEIQRIHYLSEKLGRRYSILVRQRPVDKEAFDFWEIMKKNSDDLGGIFSPLPSLLRSNLKNLNNPSEKVIGYVSLGKSTEKRLYISREEVKPWPVSIRDYDHCTYSNDTIFPRQYKGSFGGGGRVPVDAIYEGLAVIGYTAAVRTCTDCTLRGTKERPEFWEGGL